MCRGQRGRSPWGCSGEMYVYIENVRDRIFIIGLSVLLFLYGKYCRAQRSTPEIAV